MRWRGKILIEGRGSGCRNKMDNNEEKEDARRSLERGSKKIMDNNEEKADVGRWITTM
jgi:hypothetical protein